MPFCGRESWVETLIVCQRYFGVETGRVRGREFGIGAVRWMV